MMETEQRLRDLAISDSGFLFDPFSGETFTVNATGIEIIEGLRAGEAREEILEKLKHEYEVATTDDLGRDVDEFVGLLRQFGLVDKHFEL